MATITLNIAAANIAPIAILTFEGGGTEAISSGVNHTVTLDGSGSSGGSASILTYLYERRVNGSLWEPFSPTNTDTYDDTVFTTGVYEYRLLVINSLEEGSTYSNIITLNHTQDVNVPPIATIADPSTGSFSNDPIIYNRQNTNSGINLFGSGSSDSDGTIVNYSWQILSAPSGSIATINNPVTANTSINNLSEGTYVIRLTVTDNDGETDTNTITLNLTASPVIFTDGAPTNTACTTVYTGQYVIPSGATGTVVGTVISGNLGGVTGDVIVGTQNNVAPGNHEFTIELDNSGSEGVESRFQLEVTLSTGGIAIRIFNRASYHHPDYDEAVC